MKTIELKESEETVMINGKEEPHTFKTTELIRSAVNFVPPGGFLASDMMNRMRILGAMDKLPVDPDQLTLEDSDFDNLKGYVKMTGWGVLSKFIVQFVKEFDS